MQSTLERNVTKSVAATKAKERREAAAKARKEAAFQAKLPKTFEERCKLIYPSICDGNKWKVHFDAGHWRLTFTVGKLEFQIHDVYVPAYGGSGDDGYAYAHDSYWTPYLHVSAPYGSNWYEYHDVGRVSDSYIADRFKKPSKMNGKVFWDPKQIFEKAVKEVNDGIAKAVKDCLLHVDDVSWWQRFERRY